MFFWLGWMVGFFNVVFFGEVEKRDVGLFLDSEVVFFVGCLEFGVG